MKNIIGVAAVIGVLLVLIAPLSSSPVAGESGTVKVHEDYYWSYQINFDKGKSIGISYTMEITQGPYIDIFFVDKENYLLYKQGYEFEYSIALSDIKTAYTSCSATLTTTGTYYIVFDNTDTATNPPWNGVDDVAYISYTISHTITYYPSDLGTDEPPTSPTSSGMNTIAGTILFALIIAVIIGATVVMIKIRARPEHDENKNIRYNAPAPQQSPPPSQYPPPLQYYQPPPPPTLPQQPYYYPYPYFQQQPPVQPPQPLQHQTQQPPQQPSK